MAIQYPTSLDSFTNPTASSKTNSPSLAGQQSDQNDAIEALEAKVGIGSATPVASRFLVGTGTGSSDWSKVVPAGTVVGTTDSQTLTNKVLTSPTINTPTIVNPTLTTDTVSEYTAANGVAVDGLNIKDGKLNTNNSVVATNITDSIITSSKIDWTNGSIWWEELGRTTLGSASDSITISSFTARRYLRVYVYIIATGVVNAQYRFNNDSAANYAEKFATDWATSTITAATALNLESSTTSVGTFATIDILNVATVEKKTFMTANTGATGAATAPTSSQSYGKWANTASQITRIDIINIDVGDFAAGSQVVVIGHD